MKTLREKKEEYERRGYSPKRIGELMEYAGKATRFAGDRKNREVDVTHLEEFMSSPVYGRMENIEYVVGVRAADEAIQIEREFWLPTLERWLLACDSDSATASLLRMEIKRLRRCLGIKNPKPSDPERRQKTRERVQKHRALTKKYGPAFDKIRALERIPNMILKAMDV
jgi:hypothetical protein